MNTKQTIKVISVLLCCVLLIIGLSHLLSNSAKNVEAQLVDPSLEVKEAAHQLPETDENGNEYYYYEVVASQEPIAINGQAQLQTDQSYFYNPEFGEIQEIKIKDGQQVKKGDLLYTYKKADKESQYALEDVMRKQTKLYNQREVLVYQLSQMTGNQYNYQGDWIEVTDGKGSYYVIEPIGPNTQVSPSSSNVTGEEGQDAMDGFSSGEMTPDDFAGQLESIKIQIRQLNEQIEDVEIEMQRIIEKSRDQVFAKKDGKAIVDQEGKDNSLTPLVRLVSDDVSVTGHVSEYEYYLFKENLPVSIYINAEDREIEGEILSYDQYPQTMANSGDDKTSNDAISVGGSTSNGSQYGFVVQPKEFIQPGFSVKVKLTPQGFVISPAALIQDKGKDYVFVYEDGVAHRRKVILRHENGSYVVDGGLKEGDQVLLGADLLSDGQKIKIIDEMSVNTDGQS